jgi:hypothetical protein
MARQRVLIGLIVGTALLVGSSVYVFARADRPYRNGSVWNIAFIRVKPGMNEAYMNYLTGQWKQTQEALKKEGLVLSYMVIDTEAHSPTDWNLMLMTEYKDLATMEANEQKEEAVAEKVVGDDQKQMQGYKDRLEIREVMGERLARQIILEPRR